MQGRAGAALLLLAMTGSVGASHGLAPPAEPASEDMVGPPAPPPRARAADLVPLDPALASALLLLGLSAGVVALLLRAARRGS